MNKETGLGKIVLEIQDHITGEEKAYTNLAEAFEDHNSSRIHSAVRYLTLGEFTELGVDPEIQI